MDATKREPVDLAEALRIKADHWLDTDAPIYRLLLDANSAIREKDACLRECLLILELREKTASSALVMERARRALGL